MGACVVIFRVAASGVVLFHLAFILFAIFGAALVVRRAAWAWLHLPVLAWATGIELVHGICPLTPLENALRERAGEAGYGGGFIEHYLIPLIYPPGLQPSQQVYLAMGLVAVNLFFYGWAVRRRGWARAHASRS
jgi:hypothetical protein